MTTQLARYEAAKAALAEARSVDEVKSIRDKAEAVRLYARMASDTELEANAAELRLRAERRGGLLVAQMKAEGLLDRGGRKARTGSDGEPVKTVKLEDLGLDKAESRRFQKVGGIAERAFEVMVERVRADIAAGKRVSLDIAKAEDKAQRRAQRLEALKGAEGDLKTETKVNVVYADPPWKYEPYSRETGMDRSAGNHYPEMETDAIKALPVPDVTAKNCVLFMWATVPMLPEALDVMKAWGFEYKSHCIWNKDRIGTGYWFRNKHELLLVGVKGQIPAPLPGAQAYSVIDGPVKEHSRKPIIFRTLIEGLFPGLPKIELFARASGDAEQGWVKPFGKESTKFDGDTDALTRDEKRDRSLRAQHNTEVEAETPPAYLNLPQDASGAAVEHDTETGEVAETAAHKRESEDLDIPHYLRRDEVV